MMNREKTEDERKESQMRKKRDRKDLIDIVTAYALVVLSVCMTILAAVFVLEFLKMTVM